MLDKFFVYFPYSDIVATPADVGLQFDDVFITASDGVRLNGWFVPGESDVTLVWFHGNGGNISHRVDNIALLNSRVKANVFILDYRGYGLSEGKPSERGTYLDAEAAISYLISRPDVDPDKVVIYGRSLGSAVAVEMASRHQPYGLVLEAPFTSVKAMAKLSHPVLSSFLPLGMVVRSRYDSLSKIDRVNSPLMVIHGDDDEIVPFEMGRELFDAGNDPKRFYGVSGGGHNNAYVVGGNEYFDAIKTFVDALP